MVFIKHCLPNNSIIKQFREKYLFFTFKMNKLKDISKRINNLQIHIQELTDLINISNNLRVIGESESDFVILTDDTIVDFS